MLLAVDEGKLDLQLRQDGQHLLLIGGGQPAAQRGHADGAVQGAGIHVNVTESGGSQLGGAALPRAGGPVNGNVDHGFYVLSIVSQCSTLPCSVRNAIPNGSTLSLTCRLGRCF